MTDPTSVLIISHDVVDAKMAGPGIRYWELARVLARPFRVTLAVPGDSRLPPLDDIRIWPYEFGKWRSLAPALERVGVILLCGDVLAWFPELEEMGIPLIVDGYDPHTLETLALFAGAPEQEQKHRERERILRMQCQAGDFFICASERQRDWWLGLLEASGRVNVRTYGEDPSLRKLIDVVPFGLPSSPPRHTRQVLKGVWPGIRPEDKVVLWGGGVWQWLDPLTAVRAMALVSKQRDDVKLVFPGTCHPNPAVPDMSMRRAAVQLAEEMGLRGRRVFFGDWVDYDEWPNYLLESDVGLSLHFDTLETRLAFRSRVLDYIWAGLAVVATKGDATSDLISSHGLGLIVGYENPGDVAESILALLQDTKGGRGQQFALARVAMAWEQSAQPLVAFCGRPCFAADRRSQVNSSRGIAAQGSDHLLYYPDEMRKQIETMEWYHSIDFGNGVVSAGHYDHRPYLHYYGIPEDLSGKTVLDVGAASGFFSFEMERRGAIVTAIDLPSWFDHDFGPRYKRDKSPEEGLRYLQDSFLMARRLLRSRVEKLEMTIYDVSPETVGKYDLVFCGSLLLHLTDPIRALWRLQSVVNEQAIIATSIYLDSSDDPRALFVGHDRGDAWWLPNRACLEAMVESAGFADWEWVSDFRLDYADGRPGPHHGVIRAWTTPERPKAPSPTPAPVSGSQTRGELLEMRQMLEARETEIVRLRKLLEAYEQGSFIRFMKWLHGLRERLGL